MYRAALLALLLTGRAAAPVKEPPMPPLPADIGNDWHAYQLVFVAYKGVSMQARSRADTVISVVDDEFRRDLWSVLSFSDSGAIQLTSGVVVLGEPVLTTREANSCPRAQELLRAVLQALQSKARQSSKTSIILDPKFTIWQASEHPAEYEFRAGEDRNLATRVDALFAEVDACVTSAN